MKTLTATRTEQTVAHDWHFAEFVMHTWTDPELAEWYQRDPVAALASFGMWVREEAAASAAFIASLDPVVVDDIDHPAPLSAAFTFCG